MYCYLVEFIIVAFCKTNLFIEIIFEFQVLLYHGLCIFDGTYQNLVLSPLFYFHKPRVKLNKCKILFFRIKFYTCITFWCQIITSGGNLQN